MKQSQISNINIKMEINYINKHSNASCFSPEIRSEAQETKVEQPLSERQHFLQY